MKSNINNSTPPDRPKTLAWRIQHRSRKEFIGLMYLED